jgi:mycoredoxin
MADSTPTITVYVTRWCGHCRRLKRQLDEAGIAVELIDIDLDEHASHGSRIEALTGGYRVVPTVEVGGRLLVNPSVARVQAALAELSRN